MNVDVTELCIFTVFVLLQFCLWSQKIANLAHFANLGVQYFPLKYKRIV